MHATFEYIMIYGAFLSTTGAGLQSLTGAPRLLQDRIIFPGNKIQIPGASPTAFSGNRVQKCDVFWILSPEIVRTRR